MLLFFQRDQLLWGFCCSLVTWEVEVAPRQAAAGDGSVVGISEEKQRRIQTCYALQRQRRHCDISGEVHGDRYRRIMRIMVSSRHREQGGRRAWNCLTTCPFQQRSPMGCFRMPPLWLIGEELHALVDRHRQSVPVVDTLVLNRSVSTHYRWY